MTADPFTIRHISFNHRDGLNRVLKVNVVPTHTEHVAHDDLPDLGAFDIQHYKRTVEISVSPTGRSVRIWVDGKEIR